METGLWIVGAGIGLWLLIKVLQSRPVTVAFLWLFSWLTVWTRMVPLLPEEIAELGPLMQDFVPGQPFQLFGVSIKQAAVCRGVVLAASRRTRVVHEGGYLHDAKADDVVGTVWTECFHGWWAPGRLPRVHRKGTTASRAYSAESGVGLIIIYDLKSRAHIALQPGFVSTRRSYVRTAL